MLIGWKNCSEDQKEIKKRYGEVVSRKKTVGGASDSHWNDLSPSFTCEG